MNIYKISCYSKCGTYFASYLKSVTVLAESKQDAIHLTKLWLHKECREFLNMDESKWDIEEVTKGTAIGVFDWNEDSDY